MSPPSRALAVRALLVMGVSGSGKTTLGAALAARLGWVFADADDYHPAVNIEKMRRGEALTDADREPWLGRLHEVLEASLGRGQPLVLACSALKASYREQLIGDLRGSKIIFLHGAPDLIAERMRTRQHFMPPGLLESQLNSLEPPVDALTLDVRKPVAVLVSEVMLAFHLVDSQPM